MPPKLKAAAKAKAKGKAKAPLPLIPKAGVRPVRPRRPSSQV